MPFRYLGIPLVAVKLRVTHYAPFIDKLAGYINAWTGASLSYAGRAELIRVVLHGVDCFWLSILSIPADVIDRIIKLCRLFLWRSNHPLVAWKEICLPKSEGGLGFKDLESWNTTLLAKTLWNIHCKKDSLLIKWVSNQYFGSASIWDRAFNIEDSPLIKKLSAIRDSLILSEGSSAAAIQRLSSWVSDDHLSIKVAYDFFRPKGRKICWVKDVWC